MQSVFKKLGFRLRLFDDPELMDRNGKSSWFHADESITYLQLKPARKHIHQVLKRLDLAYTVSKRTAHFFCDLMTIVIFSNRQ